MFADTLIIDHNLNSNFVLLVQTFRIPNYFWRSTNVLIC